MTETHLFPARPLFTMTAPGMNRNRLSQQGPMGTRTVSAPDGGTFEGPAINGRIAPGLANEWQLQSAQDPDICFVEGLMTLLTEGGAAILMKYIGRRSAFYADGWRIGACFEADGEADWLNDVVAAGVVEAKGDDLQFTLHALLGRQGPMDANALTVEPLYTMAASGSVGERYKIDSPIGGRYLSIAENGCRTEGRLVADWPAGFSWGAHRTGSPGTNMGFPFHIDLTVGLRAEDGSTILQHYIGTNSRELLDRSPDVDRSWRTVAMFEAPVDGPHAWLNQVIALGHGWTQDQEAHYAYHVMR